MVLDACPMCGYLSRERPSSLCPECGLIYVESDVYISTDSKRTWMILGVAWAVATISFLVAAYLSPRNSMVSVYIALFFGHLAMVATLSALLRDVSGVLVSPTTISLIRNKCVIRQIDTRRIEKVVARFDGCIYLYSANGVRLDYFSAGSFFRALRISSAIRRMLVIAGAYNTNPF